MGNCKDLLIMKNLPTMSQYASKKDFIDAINNKINKLVKKRDYAADNMNNVLLAWSYQEDIDQLTQLLDNDD